MSVLLLGAAYAAPSDVASAEKERIARFKASGGDIQAIFKKHLGAGDYAAIEAAATRLADWADEMPSYFPAGSDSEGAKPEIWEDFDDFKAKAAANAAATCAIEILKCSPFRLLAKAIPSLPTINSWKATPASAHILVSLLFIARDALVTSGYWTPIPLQNSFMPPPVPVDSTTGVLKPLDCPNFSAAIVENG